MPPTCPHCGKTVLPIAQFCGYCGASLAQTIEDYPDSLPQTRSPMATSPQPRRLLPGWVIAVFVCMATLVCLTLGLLELFGIAPPGLFRPTFTPTPTATLTPTATSESVYSGPYAQGMRPLRPDLVIGQPGDLDTPRGIAAAPDGSIYFTDSDNYRVIHVGADGTILESWGSYADISAGDAPGGTFNWPWGIAVGPDGCVYVADTWNHRIQKFTAQGEFIDMWGTYGTDGSPYSFWGPRDIKFDTYGRMFVTDTGNKRVIVFTPDGDYISQFGSAGSDRGYLDEPSGIAIDRNNILYITDTWNHRIQSFTPNQNGMEFSPLLTWDIDGWAGYDAAANEPYIAVALDGSLLVTDPEAGQILQFSPSGDFLRGWDHNDSQNGSYSIFNGIAVDTFGNVWVVDAANNQVLRFHLP
jgi:streptogramin lyase